MKIYNKFGVFKWEGVSQLSQQEQKDFMCLFKKVLNITNRNKAQYFVIGKGEKFAPAVKELIKAYCD